MLKPASLLWVLVCVRVRLECDRGSHTFNDCRAREPHGCDIVANQVLALQR